MRITNPNIFCPIIEFGARTQAAENFIFCQYSRFIRQCVFFVF